MKKIFKGVFLNEKEVNIVKKAIDDLYDVTFQQDDLQLFFESLDAIIDIANILEYVPKHTRQRKNKRYMEKVEAYGAQL